MAHLLSSGGPNLMDNKDISSIPNLKPGELLILKEVRQFEVDL